MSTLGRGLRSVMNEANTTADELSRMSGVRRGELERILSGDVRPDTGTSAALLACLGYRIAVGGQPVKAELTRSARRSWLAHRRIAARLSGAQLVQWHPTIKRNLWSLQGRVQGQPHVRNLARWRALVDGQDLDALRLVLIGVDEDAIEMREVSPLKGILPEQDLQAFD